MTVGVVPVMRRRLFWRIYLTLLASLVATAVLMGTFFWFLGQTQREVFPPPPPPGDLTAIGPGEVSLYAADGRLLGARGPTIAAADIALYQHGPRRVVRINLPDGRFVLTRAEPPHPRALALRIVMIMLVTAGGVGLAAYPVTMLLTRRLEALRVGVSRWGDDATPVRLDDSGNDEVAALAGTFNVAAARLGAMLAAQKALLTNASHELRSPLARLRMAVEVDGAGSKVSPLRAEIVRNLAEMDQLVDELLLSSRLDHPGARDDRRETIDLLGLAAEEAARTGAVVGGEPVEILGDFILLRRLIRNLLENGAKHGRAPVTVDVAPTEGGALIVVGDAGPGIAAMDRERIFEPFFRPAGSAETAGGWGLGLALVRQIAERHGGGAACREDAAGGSRFVVRLRGKTDG